MGERKGMTLLEAMLAVGILAIALMGFVAVLVNVNMINGIIQEDTAALNAAHEVMSAVRTANLQYIGLEKQYKSNLHYVYQTYRNYTFDVKFYHGARTNSLGIPDSNGTPRPPGEVVLALDESPQEGDYGRDLDGNGQPDGIDLNQDGALGKLVYRTGAQGESLFPLDLNGDGDFNDRLPTESDQVDAYLGAIKLMPVAVAVRWRREVNEATAGVTLMTVIAKITEAELSYE